MKEMDESEERYFKELMSKSKLEMPFSDLEDRVMLQIEKRDSGFSVARDIRLSWIVFLLGSVFGIIISWILHQMHGKILGVESQKLAVFFQIIFVVIVFTQLELLSKIKKRNTLF